MVEDEGLEDEVKQLKNMPLHLGAFVLSISKKIMNNFIHTNNGFYTKEFYYGDTDSLYVENKHWDYTDKAGLSRKGLIQGKDDYEDCGIFYGLFLAPKVKYCLTICSYGNIEEYKTFKSFENVSHNLGGKESFKKLNGTKMIAKVPLSWKKGFDCGFINLHKLRCCNKTTNKTLCDKCDKLVNQTKEFSANLNELKRQPANSFGHMLPWYVGDLEGYLRRFSN